MPSHRLFKVCAFPTIALLLLATCGDSGRQEEESTTVPTTGPSTTDGTDTESQFCMPEMVRCFDTNTIEVCDDYGKWVPQPCGDNSTCVICDGEGCTEDMCVGPCQTDEELQSSAGCAFIGTRTLHDDPGFLDALVVGNPSASSDAAVQINLVVEGTRKEELQQEEILSPGETIVFELDADFVDSHSTKLRTGGVHTVTSNLPVVVYQQPAPSDASMLIPNTTLGQKYVVASYPPYDIPEVVAPDVSYATIVALADETTVEWTPQVDTDGAGAVDPVLAGETGTQVLNKFDTLRIAAALAWNPIEERDISGTVINADKNIWVVGGTSCARVPTDAAFCDHLQEQIIPLKHWGNTYVAAASPVRTAAPWCGMMMPCGAENHYWRVFAGEDGVTITTTPPQPGTPVTLAKRGDWVELPPIPTGTNFVFEGDGAFMPVQYISGAADGGGYGDPAMSQMVPVEQFLGRYVFVTPTATEGLYDEHYVQVVRSAGAADVTVDGDTVTGYMPVGAYEVANWLIDGGSHVAESEDAFGITQVGYRQNGPDYPMDPMDIAGPYASYAYPGGMKTEEIFIP